MLADYQVKIIMREHEAVDRRQLYDIVRGVGRIVDFNMNDLTNKGLAFVTFTTKDAVAKMLAKGILSGCY